MEELLHQHGYARLNPSMIRNPKRTPTEQLYTLATQGSFDYLLDLSCKQLSKDAYSKRIRERDQVRHAMTLLKQDTTGDFCGQRTWMDELTRVCEVVHRGHTQSWKVANGIPVE
jgi:hypothetical protein